MKDSCLKKAMPHFLPFTPNRSPLLTLNRVSLMLFSRSIRWETQFCSEAPRQNDDEQHHAREILRQIRSKFSSIRQFRIIDVSEIYHDPPSIQTHEAYISALF